MSQQSWGDEAGDSEAAGNPQAAAGRADAYIAQVSHELRTPLTAILGYTELLIAEDCTAAERIEFAQTISRNGEQIQRVSARLLMAVRDEVKSQEAQPRPPVSSSDTAPIDPISTKVTSNVPSSSQVSSLIREAAESIANPAPVSTAGVPVTAGPAFESPACGLTPSAFDSTAATSYAGEGRIAGTVLVAEDSKDNQRLITFFLRHFGLECVVAENGQIAVEMANEAVAAGRPFDLVLMDIGMPIMDGLMATAALRAGGMTTPIVALTAHALAGDRERCLAAGCSDYISKPIERSMLAQMLTKYLSTRESAASPNKPTAAITPIQGSDASRTLLQQLPSVVAKARQLSTAGDDANLRPTLAQLRQSASELGLCQAAALAAAAESTLRLGADRMTIRKAVDDALACARRTDGYDMGRESMAA